MAESEARHEEATSEKEPGPNNRKSLWLEVVKAVAMPLVTLVLGFVLNASLTSRQARENAALGVRRAYEDNMRLNAEMMGRRIDADSALRKDMLNSVLSTFGRYENRLALTAQLDQQLLNLELLASNFQESLDLKPLFQQVRRQIPSEAAGPYAERARRLEKLAQQVNQHQLTELSQSGTVERGDTEPQGINDLRAYLQFGYHALNNQSLRPGEGAQRLCLSAATTNKTRHYRQFKLEPIGYDPATREVQMHIYVSRLLDQAECARPDNDLEALREVDTAFWVDQFDFPMIHNTRLTSGERCAVSLIALTPNVLSVALTYFPGSRARLNYDEVMLDLMSGNRPAGPTTQ